jgi:uncharacterized protein (DUF1697 family)
MPAGDLQHELFPLRAESRQSEWRMVNLGEILDLLGIRDTTNVLNNGNLVLEAENGSACKEGYIESTMTLLNLRI